MILDAMIAPYPIIPIYCTATGQIAKILYVYTDNLVQLYNYIIIRVQYSSIGISRFVLASVVVSVPASVPLYAGWPGPPVLFFVITVS